MQTAVAVPERAVQVVEFHSKSDYEQWLEKNDSSVKIVDVATTKRWSLMTGFLGDAKTYTVTYEVPANVQAPASAPLAEASSDGKPSTMTRDILILASIVGLLMLVAAAFAIF